MMYPFYKHSFMNYCNPYNFSPVFGSFNTSNVNVSNRRQFGRCFGGFDSSFSQTVETDSKELPRGFVKSDEKTDCFEIFGFKLFYDDLIVIGLIFLLFNEGVNDQLLIIALVLLIGD